MIEKRLKELCYDCDELFVPDHQCKQLFWFEIEHDTDPEQQEKTNKATISTI